MVLFYDLKSYIKAFQGAFQDSISTLGRGRTKQVAWLEVVLVQVIKHYVKGNVAEVEQRIV
jgi:hypothetical protein